MTLPIAPRTLAELCADGRIVPLASGGVWNNSRYRGVQEGDPFLDELLSLPRSPGGSPLVFESDDKAGALTLKQAARTPPEARDLLVHRPPPPVGGLDAYALGELADRFGMPVEIPRQQLAAPVPGRTLEQLEHRLVPLRADGPVSTLGDAEWVRVVPARGGTTGAYETAPDEVKRAQAEVRYPSWGRIVFLAGGEVQLGWPAALADHRYGGSMARFGRPLDEVDVAAVAAPPVALDGYVDLIRRLESAPGNRQAYVQVTDERGDVSTFLAHRDPRHVAVLDPGTGRSARLPAGRVRIQLTALPGVRSLDDRLDAIRDARLRPADLPTSPIAWPRDARPVGSAEHPVVVFGPEALPASLLADLTGWADQIGQPILVVGAGRTRQPVPSDQLPALRSLLSQFGDRWKVPVVLTFGAVNEGRPETAELYAALDTFGASLVRQVPSGLDHKWTVRPALSTGDKPPIANELSAGLLAFAAGTDRRPAFAPPPAAVVRFLGTPLGDQLRAGSPFGGTVRKLAPWVHRIAARNPAAVAYGAALALTDLGHQDIVSSVVANPGRGRDAVFGSLADIGGDTPADRQREVQTLLPQLAALVGGLDTRDVASQGVLTALNDMLAGAKDNTRIQQDITGLKSYLTDVAKADFARLIRNLANRMPAADHQTYEDLVVLILTC